MWEGSIKLQSGSVDKKMYSIWQHWEFSKVKTLIALHCPRRRKINQTNVKNYNINIVKILFSVSCVTETKK